MNPKQLQELIADKKIINKFLDQINETDQECRKEVIELMQSSQSYRDFIVDYAIEYDRVKNSRNTHKVIA
jgi:hypothetical protein